jgi:DnaK suppressor protein
MTLRKENLEAFKQQLVMQRDTLAADLRHATAELIDDEVTYTDSIDQASADTDKSLALQMKNRERDNLVRIEEALRRLEIGTFGRCARCSEEISEARIRASLFTTLCIDCKSEVESESGQRFPGR